MLPIVTALQRGCSGECAGESQRVASPAWGIRCHSSKAAPSYSQCSDC